MEVDFSFQLLRRFQPELLSQGLRSEVRSFIKETNIDTYRCLSQIWDMVQALDPSDEEGVKAAMRSMRQRVDGAGIGLRAKGESVLAQLRRVHDRQEQEPVLIDAPTSTTGTGILGTGTALPYTGVESLVKSGDDPLGLGFFGALRTPVPYAEFRKQLEARN